MAFPEMSEPPANDLEQTIAEQVSSQVKSEVVDIYEELLINIWNKIVPTLGQVTVSAIFDRAIHRTSKQFPFVEHLQVSRSHLDFSKLRAGLQERNKDNIKDGFKDLVTNLIDILAKLTGNILVNVVMQEVEGLTGDV
ncbi:hypothetical protein [Anthocerotibacter panamensis]|uniref:hypothetical protein n=1 Tax=Anthocerotibacter panamensis TaxID=2857077 RepID=UPI001C402331|nr:hypothetical protein [Anthocerotibacter panamensis]